MFSSFICETDVLCWIAWCDVSQRWARSNVCAFHKSANVSSLDVWPSYIMQTPSMAPSLTQSLHLVSPHLLYLTGLLFSFYQRAPTPLLGSCLAWSSCNSHPSPPVQFLSYWPLLYCGAVEVLEVYRTIESTGSLHCGLRGKNSVLWLYLMLEEYVERKRFQK